MERAIAIQMRHVPSGNGIVERCHRTVKRIAARKGCSVQEAVYWYNLVRQDDSSASSAPANQVHCYEMRVQGVDCALLRRIAMLVAPSLLETPCG